MKLLRRMLVFLCFCSFLAEICLDFVASQVQSRDANFSYDGSNLEEIVYQAGVLSRNLVSPLSTFSIELSPVLRKTAETLNP